MRITLASLLGEQHTFYGHDTWGRGEELYQVKPGTLQIKLASILLGKNAHLASEVPAMVKPKLTLPKYGQRYVDREHIDAESLKHRIDSACGYQFYSDDLLQGRIGIARHNARNRIARLRSQLVQDILGLD